MLDVKLMEIKEAQDEEQGCKQIKIYCMEVWPDKFHLHYAIKPYRVVRGELEELSVVHKVLLKGSRIVVPSTTRLQVLNKVHEGH